MGEAKRRGTFDERKEAAIMRKVLIGRETVGRRGKSRTTLPLLAMLATMPMTANKETPR